MKKLLLSFLFAVPLLANGQHTNVFWQNFNASNLYTDYLLTPAATPPGAGTANADIPDDKSHRFSNFTNITSAGMNASITNGAFQLNRTSGSATPYFFC